MADEQEELQRELKFLTALISNHKKTQNVPPYRPRAHNHYSGTHKHSKPHYQREKMSWTRNKDGQSNSHQVIPSKYSLRTMHISQGGGTSVVPGVRSSPSKSGISQKSDSSSHVDKCGSTQVKGQLQIPGSKSDKSKEKTQAGLKGKAPVYSNSISNITPSMESTSLSVQTNQYKWNSDNHKRSPSTITEPQSCNTDALASTSTLLDKRQVVPPKLNIVSHSSVSNELAGKLANTECTKLAQSASQISTSKTPLKTRYKYVRQNSKGKGTAKNSPKLKSAHTSPSENSPAIVTRYKYTKKSVANKYAKKPIQTKGRSVTNTKFKVNRSSNVPRPSKNKYKLVRKVSMVTSPRYGWISRFSLKKGDKMKVHNSARVIKSSQFKLVKMPLRTKSRTRHVLPSRAKLKLDRRCNKVAENTGFVSIGGIMYRRSSRKLSKTPTPVRRNDNMTIVKRTRTKLVKRASKKQSQGDKVIINVRGQRFTMDPSGKTLKRCTDSETGNIAGPSTDKGMSRLDIGGMTFVRTSPGTLVRKDTDYTKTIAQRALQRSIQTTTALKWKRSKPRQYCMFYNRFGKCNRGDKCPYIHDPDKVAVCTRFLRGTCKDSNCPFSHKVSKDKMPVCSFFLRGVCNRDDCPYLHVNVNRKAAVCEDFVKGYCPLGEKCKKRHVLECPEFTKTGVCPNGRKCKMIHKRQKTRKRKVSAIQDSETHQEESQAESDVIRHHQRKRQRSNEDDNDDSGDETRGDKEGTKRSKKLPSFISLVDDPIQDSESIESQPSTSQESLHIRPRFLLWKNTEKNQQEK